MTWRPLGYYAFIKIKLPSCHLLLYVVYTFQKSFNSIDAFNCYKQKCKLALFNLAHPVCESHLPSKFGHAKPLGSRIIRYVRDARTDRRTDGQKQRLLSPSLRFGA